MMIALLLSFLVAFSMVGCSSVNSTGDESNSNSAIEKTADNENPLEGDSSQKFYMVTFVSGFSYWKQCYRGFEDAAKLLGVTPLYGGTTEYDLNKALTELEQIIATNPAGIAVTCMDPDAYAPVIDKAIEQGIPVVTFDIDSPSSNRYTYLGTNDYDAGAVAARYIAEELGGKGRVAAFTVMGQSNIKERTDGFEATLNAEYPEIEVVQIVDTGETETEAAATVSTLLVNNENIDYLFCTTVIASTGAQQALKELGLEGKTKIIAFDTDSVTLDAIRDGKVSATITQAPWVQGFWSMFYLYFIANDELITSVDDWKEKGYPSFPPTADSGAAVVTIENYMNFYAEE